MKKHQRQQVGKRIKEILKEHSCTQADVARQISRREGISFKAAEVMVHRIVTGLNGSLPAIFDKILQKSYSKIHLLEKLTWVQIPPSPPFST